jgi:hypothetical protein
MDVKTEEWRRLHNEELRDLYSSPNIIRAIKTNEVVRHVSRTGTGEVHTGFWWRDLRVRDHLEDVGLGERIIL